MNSQPERWEGIGIVGRYAARHVDSITELRRMSFLTVTLAVAVVAFLLVADGAQASLAASPTGEFRSVGSMSARRELQMSAPLPDGKVLITGGWGTAGKSDVTRTRSSSEVFDPELGRFRSVGALHEPKFGAYAVALSDGRVLVGGGDVPLRESSGISVFKNSPTAEIFDPSTNRFSSTGSMNVAREYPQAVLLHDGRVLVMGGGTPDSSSSQATAEVYDPKSGTFSMVGPMNDQRTTAAAVTLSDGKVLIVGGGTNDTRDGTNKGVASAEIFNPDTGTFAYTGSMRQARIQPTATLLENGNVLVAGGIGNDRKSSPLASAEIYDPAKGQFTSTDSLSIPRANHTATRLLDGRVLIVGGQHRTRKQSEVDESSAEIYDPATNSFKGAGSMRNARINHTATLTSGGRVLVAGGSYNYGIYLSSAELFVPSASSSALRKFRISPSRARARSGSIITFFARLTNASDVAIRNIRICVMTKPIATNNSKKCGKIGRIAPHKRGKIRIQVRTSRYNRTRIFRYKAVATLPRPLETRRAKGSLTLTARSRTSHR